MRSLKTGAPALLAWLLVLSWIAPVRASSEEGFSPSRDSLALARVSVKALTTLRSAHRPGPLRAGEDLAFDVHYGVVHAGDAHMQILDVIGPRHSIRPEANERTCTGQGYQQSKQATANSQHSAFGQALTQQPYPGNSMSRSFM